MTSTVAELMREAEQGDAGAATKLFAALYQELRDLAERNLGRNRGDLTLGTTTLLHEAYLQFSRREQSGRDVASFPDQLRFLSYASKTMRRLIIDYTRARRATKRGGAFQITRIGDLEPPADDPSSERLEALSRGLDQLGEVDPQLAELVDLHFFCGYSFTEIASLRSVSDRTIQRDWRKARVLLRRVMEDEDAEGR